VSAKHDGRQRAISVTKAGHAALKVAVPLWKQAQNRFETANGAEKAAALRETLRTLQFDPR
jgi:DNA-binding MarR family transcriptional regulator